MSSRKEKINMKMKKGDKFFATWTPDFINGEENMRSQSISRRANLGRKK